MRRRVIDRLRRLFPDQTWSYDREAFMWVGTTFNVRGESHNYDDSSGYHDVKYARTDTYQIIEELGQRREYCG